MTRLRIRPGVHYAPIDGGVYFSSARATFVMRGPTVLFRVVDTCVPLLEDGTTVDQLVEVIGVASCRPLVDHLVSTLDSRGLLLRLDQLVVAEPSAAERQRFPEALAYLETFRDQPYADFRRVRKARVIMAGPADALGPAARGLVRAGVGQVIVATPEPDRLAGLASRHPEVRLLVHEGDAVPTLLAGPTPDAAVIFSHDSFPTDTLQRLPASCIAIPVRLGKDLAIVGPAISHADRGQAVEALWTRAATWSRRDCDELLVRPSGDLLSGALAGQLALDALVGLHRGRVHLVHGPDLRSDSITPPLGGEGDYDSPSEFRAHPADSVGSTAAATDTARESAPDTAWLDNVSVRWAGLFRVNVPGSLPQMPLALSLADGRTTCFDGRAVGFGPDQEASTTEAGLEALRQHNSAFQRAQRRGAPGERAASGAGVDEGRWMLDGALRLIGAFPGDESTLDAVQLDHLEARRLWRTLEEHELIPVRLISRRITGFEWVLVAVHDRRNGARLAGGWGPTAGVGAVAALSAAIAAAQVRRAVDPGYQAPVMPPGFLQHLHATLVGELTAAVASWLGARGYRLQGRRLRCDPVAGAIGAWCGTVWLDG
ncbi:MAG: hypothetical protein QOF30_2642 [Acidimicrobiaceae bacterium]|nr:hypothetical protein [Acidimicrobiaceae bacterium]